LGAIDGRVAEAYDVPERSSRTDRRKFTVGDIA